MRYLAMTSHPRMLSLRGTRSFARNASTIMDWSRRVCGRMHVSSYKFDRTFRHCFIHGPPIHALFIYFYLLIFIPSMTLTSFAYSQNAYVRNAATSMPQQILKEAVRYRPRRRQMPFAHVADGYAHSSPSWQRIRINTAKCWDAWFYIANPDAANGWTGGGRGSGSGTYKHYGGGFVVSVRFIFSRFAPNL